MNTLLFLYFSIIEAGAVGKVGEQISLFGSE